MINETHGHELAAEQNTAAGKMSNTEELISVIVPVYKVEKYLRKCLDSICGQTWRNLEIILVDDGSPDGCGTICDEYASKDSRVKVIHKENGGLSDARNRGLEESSGEYIAFIDSDDYIDARYMEVLYGILSWYHADLAICDHQSVSEKQIGQGNLSYKAASALPPNWKENAEVISKAEAYRRILINDGMHVSAFGKLYHRKIFDSIRYPVGELYEDSHVIGQVVENSSRIVCTRYAGYYYVRRKGSICHQGMTPKHWVALKNAERLRDFIMDRYPEVENAVKYFYLHVCIQLISYMALSSGKAWRRESRELRRIVLREWRFLLGGRYTQLWEKMEVVCLLPGSLFYRLIYRAYIRLIERA